ncbi:MAG TPA: iron-containing alcohol dehydrogenase [Planctomycetes bacterium]|nr:iron-containing alcohol dehydrogenase [Fuerstiella sp.]HIK95842.1 iron-containing alcohol dehydrogenase [Planctomycetota bacterium]
MPTISYLTDIHFSPGAVTLLPEILAEKRLKRPLLVTDAGIVAAGLVDRLDCDMAATFTDVSPNPTQQNVMDGVAVFQHAECDSIVALGGGSPIDCAKAISLMATHEEPLEQYALIRGGLPKITGDKPQVVAIPTTSGTGSEVGRATLIVFDATTKLAIVGRSIIPDVAICDPNLTLTLPAGLTAATGMDAISHCVETFCSTKFNPIADAIAADGLQRGCNNLRTAVNDGDHLQARSEMMMASMQGALAFQKGLGMIHSLSHPLGAIPKQLHHGTLNSIFLPHVLRFNAEACPEKMSRMASVIGLSSGSELPDYFEQLANDAGLPSRLSNLGTTMADLMGLAERALADHSTATNPRPMTVENCAAIYFAAF